MRRGFTLIELLVVIAIIAILAAILFPVFARAREKARQASCQSNLKQMALAMAMYATDYDGMFPNDWGYPPSGGTGITTPADSRVPVNPLRYMYWSNAIQPYVKNWNLYRCPSTKGLDWYSPGVYLVYLSYQFNGLLANIPDSGVTAPAKCILLWEGTGNVAPNNAITTNTTYGGGSFPYKPNDTTDVLWVYSGALYGFHNGGDNKAYCDGHVKWTKEPGNWDQSVWGSLGPNGEPGSYWYDNYCGWLFRPVVE